MIYHGESIRLRLVAAGSAGNPSRFDIQGNECGCDNWVELNGWQMPYASRMVDELRELADAMESYTGYKEK